MSPSPKEDLEQNGRVKNLEVLPTANPVDFVFAADRPWHDIDADTRYTYELIEDLTTNPVGSYVSYAVSVVEQTD